MNQKFVKLNDTSKEDYWYQETLKILRTNIMLSGKNNKVILFTSTFPNEGKSEVSLNLAVELAKNGEKVLFLDSDIRNSVINTKTFIKGEQKGLSEYLNGMLNKVEDIIYPTSVENLSIIISGPIVPNPSELLGDSSFEELVDYGRKNYDYVIVDTPPMGVMIADTTIISQACDAAVIIIESNVTRYRDVKKVKQNLERSGCKVIGAVLNKAEIKGSKYGKYGKYGEYGRGKKERKKGKCIFSRLRRHAADV